ncbi:MAG: class I SAM-dependent methyltransferase [Gemmataceae bacterium]|nr:class I SAM-dependent methyltransferase [Gemmataceae bacterium]
MNGPSTLHDPNEIHKPRRGLRAVLESKKHQRQPFAEYRRFVQHHYDGIAGKLTHVTGILTGHAVLAGRVFRPSGFDVRGCKRILDAGCGNGRYTKNILRWADPDALITAFDLSQSMLRRARRYLKSSRISHVAADVTRLPYPDNFFDCVVCGWMLEHLPDPLPGLRELARVLQPAGKMLLMVTEDTVTGAVCSRMWHCRTYNRHELRRVCDACGLEWRRPLYFTRIHRVFRLGGIIVELVKR